MRLSNFRAKYLGKLLTLKRELEQKYPDKRERVEYVCDILANKLSNLRTHTLADYLFTLHLAIKEFSELKELIPTTEEVEEILDEED
jgi:5'-3' exonuclease